ncbi:MAG: redoxin domain-containing protein [Rhodobacteraceae bacterium]|nr:redoxin domain-containing protein [Paracoccaceae bacterium]
MSSYNYDKFSTDDYEFDTVVGPKIGDKAPDFELTTNMGEPKRLLDFDTDFLVLEMGSITCPLFQSRRGTMGGLEGEFNQVTCTVLYVREAHPGSEIKSHQTIKDKQSCALRLKEQDNETRLILVDDFEGDAHKAYGSMPNSVFIINQSRTVVFRAQWNNPSAVRNALKALIAGKNVTAKAYFRPPLPWRAIHTFKQAGKGSAPDFFKGLPFLIWQNIVKRNLRLLFSKP